MVMDRDITRWILDFLVRQPIDDSTLAGLLNSLPISNSDSNLKKLLILRKIESEISNGMVSEDVLELLEQMEELEFRDNVAVGESMKKAYCAVAVDCAVRVLENEGLERYFEVVKKIWESRIGCMMKFKNAGLVSYDLMNWKEDIESAIWNERVCKEVLEKWKGMDVVGSVRGYVEDVREKMGPSFLEVVCKEMSDDALKQMFGFTMEEDEDEGSHEQTDVTKDNLKEQNKTVRDEFADGAAGRTSGPHLSTPEKSDVPLKKDENPKPLRRKRKAWSDEEECTLREGVKEYGVGNWKFILNTYKDIFDDRTAVDLKDKWRNLTS